MKLNQSIMFLFSRNDKSIISDSDDTALLYLITNRDLIDIRYISLQEGKTEEDAGEDQNDYDHLFEGYCKRGEQCRCYPGCKKNRWCHHECEAKEKIKEAKKKCLDFFASHPDKKLEYAREYILKQIVKTPFEEIEGSEHFIRK